MLQLGDITPTPLECAEFLLTTRDAIQYGSVLLFYPLKKSVSVKGIQFEADFQLQFDLPGNNVCDKTKGLFIAYHSPVKFF